MQYQTLNLAIKARHGLSVELFHSHTWISTNIIFTTLLIINYLAFGTALAISKGKG